LLFKNNIKTRKSPNSLQKSSFFCNENGDSSLLCKEKRVFQVGTHLSILQSFLLHHIAEIRQLDDFCLLMLLEF
ncbi:hypothetical protein, partial [Fibrobacter intestinalis]|uniref:hypothetical protein n=1 Tax=Fibrobacter intestinalis TaxID=28122 RepID=UPI001F33409A